MASGSKQARFFYALDIVRLLSALKQLNLYLSNDARSILGILS